MKKGLLALTMLIVFAASVYAYAPVLSNIPDVIIGDMEDDDGTTNFFRFSDAFMFDSNVADQDDADADLKWSWVKVSGTGDVTINGLGEESTSTINPTNELRAAGLGASFRDISASPVSQDPGPYSGTLSDVFIAVHVSDGVAEDSQELRVTSVDGAVDGNSGIVPEVIEGFTGDNAPNGTDGNFWQQWVGMTAPTADTTKGEYDADNDRLVIKCPSGLTGWYMWAHIADSGFGLKETVTYTADKLVAVKVSVSATKADENPAFRLRIGSVDNLWSGMASIGSNTTGGANGPTTTPQDFVYVYKPQFSTANAYIAFDHWTGTATNDEIYINGYSIYKIDEPAMTAEATADLSTFVKGDGDAGKVTIGSSISIADTATWATAANFINLTNTLAPGTLLKSTYSVSSTGTGNCNGIRMRLNDPANNAYVSMFRLNEDGTALDLNATAKDLVCYHVVGNVSTQTAVWTDSVAVNTSTTDNATTVFEGVVLESGDLPVLN